MIAVVVAIVLILLLAAVVTAVVVFRRAPGPVEASVTPPAPEPDRSAEREQAQSVGTELLARRVELDARRGALQGDAGIDAEFDRLVEQLRSGAISEEEFEREKIRLLGG